MTTAFIRTRTRLRLAVVTLGAVLAVLLGGLGPGTASAAPAGQVDAGVPFSSIVYGTGCTYSLTVPSPRRAE
ncbi:hypothetical protein GCM10009624_15820 [Gordonia sinesedis]